MRRAALAIIAALLPVAAQARDSCLAPTDLEALLTATAPVLIDTAARTCATAGRPLAAATPLAARWQPEADAAWPAARVAANRLGGSAFPVEISDEALRPLVRDIVGSMLAKEIRPDSCGPIDGLLRAASPLDAGGFARLVVSLVFLVGPKSPGLPLCPAGAK